VQGTSYSRGGAEPSNRHRLGLSKNLFLSQQGIKLKNTYLSGILSGAAIATILLSPINASAAIDMFLKIDGIEGESVDAKHKGEIEVLAWSWGESKTTPVQTNGGSAGGKALACITDLVVTKYVDAATPKLITDTVLNTNISSAKLSIRKAGEKPFEYFTITMDRVSIASYSTGGSNGEDRMTENIGLHFNSAQGEYIPQDPTGQPGKPILWSVSENGGRGNPQCP
jgi:type VI secretion system secreted protein Hcp